MNFGGVEVANTYPLPMGMSPPEIETDVIGKKDPRACRRNTETYHKLRALFWYH
jgi:hypothetical protein